MPLSDNECNNMGFFIEEIYRNQSRSVFATLVKYLGDVDVAEEALHDAFKAALEQWPRDGIPANPRAWLVSTGRFKGIDAIRRRSRFDALPDDIEERLPVEISDELDGEGIEDDRLRLIFTCCHPALAADAQVALTLPSGDLVLLEDQDRTLWDKDTIAEGSALVEQALASRQFGTYSLQAAISAVHANAPSASATDWAEIVNLYNILLSINPSPVIELNRAVAIAMRDNPQAGLTLIDAILERGELTDYHLAHSAKADLHRRLGKTEEAKAAYETALKLAVLEPERRFLEGRLRELPD